METAIKIQTLDDKTATYDKNMTKKIAMVSKCKKWNDLERHNNHKLR